REIWSGNYFKAIPITVQDFDLTAVLPAVFYMFRFSHRRGKGKFLDVFGEPISGRKQGKKAATIEEVARKLASSDDFRGFEDEARTWFAVGKGFEDNVLLRAFCQGVTREGILGNRASDRFDERVEVGLDQLLMVRLAQALGEAPDKLRGAEGEKISNQRPIAE